MDEMNQREIIKENQEKMRELIEKERNKPNDKHESSLRGTLFTQRGTRL